MINGITGTYINVPKDLGPEALDAMANFLGANELAKGLNITAVVKTEGKDTAQDEMDRIDASNGQILADDPNGTVQTKVIINEGRMFLHPPLPEKEEDDWKTPNTPQTRILVGLFTVAVNASRTKKAAQIAEPAN